MLRIAHDALTFDDVLLLPAYSQVLPSEVSLETRLTRDIKLNIPLMSAAMDTVTEARLAIALAQEGGIGIVHKNMSVDAQAREVRAVKKFESGIIRDPITIHPDRTVADLIDLTLEHKISGVPVVEGDALVGIITSRDVRFERRMDARVRDVMTGRDKLVTASEDASFEEITDILHKHRIEKVLLVNDAFELRGMVTVKDINKAKAFPNACKDAQGSLRVGAAVGTGEETEQRIAALVEAGVDVLVVDTAHGHSSRVIDRVKWVRKHYPGIGLIAGNIATQEGAEALIEAGADAIKVGIGPGSICTTRIVTGIGVPQITAITEAVKVASKADVPVIADGGIRYSGDLAKAIAAGASVVMAGSLLAGTDEAPGEVELFQGRTYKAYRGMGSLGAMGETHGSSDRYFQEPERDTRKLVPEGIEGRVPYRGPVSPIVHQLMGGLRASMGYTGCPDIATMRTRPQFVRVSAASMVESHVHDVAITKEAPNYPLS
ncbi:MAG: IMP dehydrogenase [Gammaproteobacteria bacterium]|nr:IMP dehydrogenase [Gammaproteobacteria bacterium]|tara:strand:+ start:1089 stop:2558 length:1470 start_codon:yes stop_codon:yes gene_type:complete